MLYFIEFIYYCAWIDKRPLPFLAFELVFNFSPFMNLCMTRHWWLLFKINGDGFSFGKSLAAAIFVFDCFHWQFRPVLLNFLIPPQLPCDLTFHWVIRYLQTLKACSKHLIFFLEFHHHLQYLIGIWLIFFSVSSLMFSKIVHFKCQVLVVLQGFLKL